MMANTIHAGSELLKPPTFKPVVTKSRSQIKNYAYEPYVKMSLTALKKDNLDLS